MNTGSNNQISTRQAIVILINYILAAGILTLPRTSAEKVGTTDVWLAVLIGGAIAIAAGSVMARLSDRYPGRTFFQYSTVVAGKWVGGIVSLAMIVYFIWISAFEVRTMAEVTSFFLLEGTPNWAIVIAFMWVGIYLVVGGIDPIARLFEIVLPITIIIFVLVTLLSMRIFEFQRLRPVLGLGFVPVLEGIKTTTLAFLGPEILLVITAFMKRPGAAIKVVVGGVAIAAAFYLATVILVIGGLSLDGARASTWPTIDLIRSFELQGLLLERFDSLLLTIWIMQIFSTFTITLYAAAKGASDLFKRGFKPFVYCFLPIIFLCAMMPKNINETFQMGDIIGNVALYLFGVVPLLFLGLSFMRRRRR
ncbi:GerAB/ArcD/ProY family transporter [Cohnella sp.]|uniref:GerAB/ArcD/ProY family transporter n=1 Tax=Cohnella sp. TaxID=1883426 RepID=UPI0035637BB0